MYEKEKRRIRCNRKRNDDGNIATPKRAPEKKRKKFGNFLKVVMKTIIYYTMRAKI
mgnify:CR=1 FL=1